MSVYEVKAHKVYKDANLIRWTDTNKKGGKITPKYIVIHYTAGASFEADYRVLSTDSRPVSCHLVLGPNGELGQVGFLNDREWHAGVSRWDGLTDLNAHSIGIEVTCPGWVEPMGKSSDGRTVYGRTDLKQKFFDDGTLVKAKHKNGGPERWWVRFTPAQIQVLKDLIPVLMAEYNIKEVVGHDMIAPTRKIDPGPCFPEQLYTLFNDSRKDVEGYEGDYEVFGTKGEGLNLRAEPNGDVTMKLQDGAKVLRHKVEGAWANVETATGQYGWVSTRYIKKA